MADFAQALDPSKLVLAETALAFATAPFVAPPYNLALFLFGTYAQEAQEAPQSLQTFTGLLGISIIFDIVWMARHEQNIFIRLLTIIMLILKLPTILAFATALRQSGRQFSSFGIRGRDITDATVWSMPGGFTSAGREGYQNVDEESPAPPPKSTQAPRTQAPAAAHSGAQSASGAYQAV